MSSWFSVKCITNNKLSYPLSYFVLIISQIGISSPKCKTTHLISTKLQTIKYGFTYLSTATTFRLCSHIKSSSESHMKNWSHTLTHICGGSENKKVCPEIDSASPPPPKFPLRADSNNCPQHQRNLLKYENQEKFSSEQLKSVIAKIYDILCF